MNIFYGRAMDGLDQDDIMAEYASVRKMLHQNGFTVVNDYDKHASEDLPLTVENAHHVVKRNIISLMSADVAVLNISIPGHVYIGCIGEMVYARLLGKKVIAIVGSSGNDNRFWTLFHSDFIVASLDDAIICLNALERSSAAPPVSFAIACRHSRESMEPQPASPCWVSRLCPEELDLYFQTNLPPQYGGDILTENWSPTIGPTSKVLLNM